MGIMIDLAIVLRNVLNFRLIEVMDHGSALSAPVPLSFVAQAAIAQSLECIQYRFHNRHHRVNESHDNGRYQKMAEKWLTSFPDRNIPFHAFHTFKPFLWFPIFKSDRLLDQM
jgi:hypothetical protein